MLPFVCYDQALQLKITDMDHFRNNKKVYQQIIFLATLLLCLTPFVSASLALLLGVLLALTIGHPFIHLNHKATNLLLKISVVFLGFGMNLHHAITAGKEGIIFTVLSISTTLLFGWLLGRWLKVDMKTSFLISGGTAICGGSAIAAIAPIIKAKEKQMSVALGAVFILNSVALLIFPVIGHHLQMSASQFGLWCAIAIHDTSSVVGASVKYGQDALQIATTIKLERALWIIPLSILTVIFSNGDRKKINIPYFIALFILAMCCSTYFPKFTNLYEPLVSIAHKGLTVTLFFIGAGLSATTIRSVGIKPFLQAVFLWAFISTISAIAILLLK